MLFVPTEAQLTVPPSFPGPGPRERTGSLDHSFLVIPTFTVTINPLEDNEITYVPDSPGANDANKNVSKNKGEGENDNW